eukprot:scaffold46305_cov212-Skeletonema_marinoi.AAC.2
MRRKLPRYLSVVEGGAVDGSGMKMSTFICYLGKRMTFWCEYITITPAGFLEKRRYIAKPSQQVGGRYVKKVTSYNNIMVPATATAAMMVFKFIALRRGIWEKC